MAMTSEQEAIRAMHGLDASRRTGWARYYDAVEERDAMRDAAVAQLENACWFAAAIVYHERLAHDDPRVIEARRFLDKIASTPAGARLVDAVTGAFYR